MEDRVSQAWLEAAHAEFKQQEQWRIAEMRAFWKQAEDAGWKDRFIESLKPYLKD